MSKVSFRARQIDFNKPLPILKNDSDLLSEFNECTLVNRGVPQIPSGMEKEEENEHHFVEVINALQLREESDVKIPVPDIIDRSHFYLQTYPDEFVLPKQLVHIRTSLLAEGNEVDYDMDSEDEEWLGKSHLDIDAEKFESMIDRLERGCGQRVMNLDEAKCLLQEDPSLAIAVYDYWLSKRVQSRQPLMYSVRQEKRDNSNNGDPYVAFRRRSEKMQTRKNRKNDEQAYEKMLTLRGHMDILSEILSRLIKREIAKEALLNCERKCFETRFQLADWDGYNLSEAESLARKPLKTGESLSELHSAKVTCKRSIRKRKLTQRALDLSIRTQSSDDVSDHEQCLNVDEPFAFIRTQGCRYLKPRNSADADDYLKVRYPHLRYSLTTVPILCHPVQRTYTGYIRRRCGRGGRIVCDRFEPSVDLQSNLSTQHQHFRPEVLRNSQAFTPQRSHAPTDSLDEALVRRLRPVILSSHRSRPCLRWPVCTKLPSSSFEALNSHPWRISRTDRPILESSPVYISEASPTQMSPPACPTFEKKVLGILGSNGMNVSLDCSQVSAGNGISVVQEVHNRVDHQSSVLITSGVKASSEVASSHQPISEDRSTASSHDLWKQLTRRYSTLEALNPTEFARPRDTDLSKSGSTNGLASRLSQTSEDRLLRKDSSVLPPKLCCVSRDCVSIDPAISGPHLQTANGMSSTQFCQLPT